MPNCFVNAQWRLSLAGAAFVASLGVMLSAPSLGADVATRLSIQDDAQRIGLKRAWFAQVRLDPARNDMERAVLMGNRLSVLTSAGVLHELNALTGETMWIAPVGNPEYPSLGPTANEQYVALINGSTLYVLDRIDGRPVKIRAVGGAPGAAPALSSKHVFVPLFTGRIEAYPLDEQILTPWYYQSFGRAVVPPLATAESFVWATDAGRLYVGRLPELGVRFRLETSSEILAQPAYRKPFVYAATIDGEVFAMHELTGARRWKYATGFPVTRAAAAVEDRVFVTSEEPALHCIDAEKGLVQWEAPNITQFAALSRDRVYGVDKLGRLVALDAKSGAVIGRMPTDIATHALVNDQTDRIYLISQTGLVQCLHELTADEPLDHKPKPTEEQQPTGVAETEPDESAEPADMAPAEPDVVEEPSPFGEVDTEVEEPEEGEPDDAEMPAENPFDADDENPFDFEN
jgi:outer membrane protein assembly factor BamB